MRTVGAYEAKTHLARLLEEVAKGETITITKHGQAVAILAPPREVPSTRPAEVIEALRQFREDVTLGGLSLSEMIDEGRP